MLTLTNCSKDDKKIDSICINISLTEKGIEIPSGSYHIGDNRFYPEEGPTRIVEIEAFNIDVTEVTNRQFNEFVIATGYVTRAERGLPESKFEQIPQKLRSPGSVVFTPPLEKADVNIGSWWRFIEGASWKQPQGPGSSNTGLENHPVVHITFEDAAAYAEWKGRRLPTEAEWEAAARGPDNPATYSWGDQPPNKLSEPPANIWQGIFPVLNQESDGYAQTAPAGCFPPNKTGLYDMIGNVWEMTASDYSPTAGVIKGGSYLCAENFCARYRPAARQPHEWALGSSHIGFRTVQSITPKRSF